jgi:hypothetical protein
MLKHRTLGDGHPAVLPSFAAGLMLLCVTAAARATATDPPGNTVASASAASDRAGPVFPAPTSTASVKPAEPPLPPGQVWQCTIDGQKTFSDKRCGVGASVRQLNEVNRMDPTPESNIHFYGGAPAYSQGAGSMPGGQEGATPYAADEIYSGPPVIVVHRRPVHGPAPRSHPHAQSHK